MLKLLLGISFLDFLTYAAIIPLVPLLLLETPHSILPADFPHGYRFILLGALLSTYPCAQMVASPLLGVCSDHMSRRFVLLLSYLGNAAGYFVFALGVGTSSISLLFLGNFLAGITGGNLVTTHAWISDSGETTKKVQHFSLSHLTIGLAFVLGPLLSHVFMLKTTPSFPFILCGLVSLLNTGVISLFFKDRSSSPFSPLQISFNWRQLFQPLFVSIFLFFFGWYFFIKFFQVFLIEQTTLGSDGFFQILSYFGFCCVITQTIFSIFLYRWIPAKPLLHLSLMVMGCAILAFLVLYKLPSIWICVTLFSIAYSLACPTLVYLVSEFSDTSSRGQMMGLYQATQSLAKMLAPGLAGLTMAAYPSLPILISALAIFGSSALLLSRPLSIAKP